jgi:hypothetical protein
MATKSETGKQELTGITVQRKRFHDVRELVRSVIMERQ